MENLIDKIKNDLKTELSKHRYDHILRVAGRAKAIANYFDFDKDKAFLAGLLHDCAKEMSNEELINACLEHDISLGERDYKDAHMLHGLVGSLIAYDRYGIEDSDVLLSIANHSGRPAMTDIEKVLMMSDLIDKFNRESIDISFIALSRSLDEAMLRILGPCLEFCYDNNISFAERTQDAFDYAIFEYVYKNQVGYRLSDEVAVDDPKINGLVKYNRDEFDEMMFDRSVKVICDHAIKLKTVSNIRDIGGYKTNDGQSVKKHMLVRSGDLSKICISDVETLKDYGISTIIDLRSTIEAESSPDINMEDFSYHHCPLPLSNPQLESFRIRMLERKKQTFTSAEEIWYNVSYLATIDMDKMYRDVFFSKSSIKQLKKIFEILSDENSGFILFHCTSGKDRTGVLAIFILYVLDVNFEDIRSDYYASMIFDFANVENYIYELIDNGYGEYAINEVRRVLSITTDFLPKIALEINERYGSLDNYLKAELGVDKAIKDKLVNKFLSN